MFPSVPSKPYILLVEQNDLLRIGARQVLLETGYPVKAVDDGDDALALALRAPYPPKMLVSDTALPGLDGVTVARTLRARWPGLPTILLAARGPDGTGLEPGLPLPCALLEKPVSTKLLAAVARKLLPPPRSKLIAA